MTQEEINHHAELMYGRQSEISITDLFSLFVRENGYLITKFWDAWYACAHRFEPTEFGDRYTLQSLKDFITYIVS